MTPLIGFHSVIDRPDSVSRVAPPTTTIARIRSATIQSQMRMAPSRSGLRESAAAACAGGALFRMVEMDMVDKLITQKMPALNPVGASTVSTSRAWLPG